MFWEKYIHLYIQALILYYLLNHPQILVTSNRNNGENEERIFHFRLTKNDAVSPVFKQSPVFSFLFYAVLLLCE